MDANRKCSHFIGYYNHMMSNFSHLNPECCYFTGCAFSGRPLAHGD